jgi:D-tagatose-1,6-bisphosphate aldolase subunit GatZ/KbaZ
MKQRIPSLNKGITVAGLLQRMRQLRVRATLLGVGPVSELTVRATFELAREKDFPPVFIASRNQVDGVQFGGGYLMGGMDQQGFVSMIREYSDQVGYTGPLYVCRDHGGPWQRNKELDERYPVERAMQIARESFAADLEAGFNYLHVDPTKCPHSYTLEDLCRWTVELVGYCEVHRREIGQGPVDYEIGAEDIRGGETSPEMFEQFLGRITRDLEAAGLPRPTCIVGQTGTLTRVDRNVGCFKIDTARRLVEMAAGYGVGFKEHNGDYLSAATCRVHPEIGIAGMNVAPEFGLVETDALLHLEELEQKLVREGWLAEGEASGFASLLEQLSFEAAPWKKWMTEEVRNLSREKIAADRALRRLIARVCGHYLYHDSHIGGARQRLEGNIDRHRLLPGPAEAFVKEQVKAAIVFYVSHFRLEGILTTLVQPEAGAPTAEAGAPETPALGE